MGLPRTRPALNGPETVERDYTIVGTASVSNTFVVSVTDKVAGETGSPPFSVVRDTTAPTPAIDVPPISSIGIPVSWGGSVDDASGIRHYNVEYREGSGAWTGWYTDTTVTEGTFIGTVGMTYTFRLTATDNVDNTPSAWTESDEVVVHGVTKYYAFGGSKVAMSRGDEVYYLGGDHLGSTSLTTDDTGTIISEVRYYPYGEERWTNKTSVTDFGFTSQRSEKSFGLMDYNARYYSPVLGRFISPDSIVPDPTSSDGFNRYRYTRNNPLKYTDPSGHCSSLAGTAWNICATVVSALAPAVHKANEYRDDIFFPDANTTFGDRLEAATVVGGAPVAIAGSVMAAPAAVPYVYSASASWTTFSASQPILAGASVGLVETAAECGLNGGCTAGDYAAGAITAGIANAGNGVPTKSGVKVLRDGEGASAADMAASIAGPGAGTRAGQARRRQELLNEADLNNNGIYTCWRCGQTSTNPADMHLGHRNVPTSLGGNMSDINTCLEGAACNLSAGNRGGPREGMSCVERGSCGAPYGR